MTLKDKLFDAVFDNSYQYKKENIVSECEVVADEFAIGFLHWYNTSQECETYLRRNYPKNITMNGEHYKKVLELNKELLEIYKKGL